jgi:uncharacterized membrane protein YtjA (UPF0391 family)
MPFDGEGLCGLARLILGSGPIFAQVSMVNRRQGVTTMGNSVSNSFRHPQQRKELSMWRLAVFLFALALFSGGLSFTCQSAAASGLALMLFVAFAVLCGLIFVLDGRQLRSYR